MKKYLVKGYYKRIKLGDEREKVVTTMIIEADCIADAIAQYNTYYALIHEKGKYYKGYPIEKGEVLCVAEIVWEKEK